MFYLNFFFIIVGDKCMYGRGEGVFIMWIILDRFIWVVMRYSDLLVVVVNCLVIF